MIPKKQILIVEDNELNRDMLSEILAEEYQVLEAENGQVALDITRLLPPPVLNERFYL